MRPVRSIATSLFAAAVAVTGCTAHSTAPRPAPPDTVVAAPGPEHPSPAPLPSGDARDPTSANRQAAVYAAVVRRFVTPGGQDSFGYEGRFPRIFVLDRAVAGAGDPTREATLDSGEPIPSTVQRAIIHALADVAPLRFVTSRAAAIDQDHPDRVRDEGILVTLGPLVGVGDRVQVTVDGFVSGVAATWLTYAVERTGSGWVVRETTAHGPVA